MVALVPEAVAGHTVPMSITNLIIVLVGLALLVFGAVKLIGGAIILGVILLLAGLIVLAIGSGRTSLTL